MWAIKTENLTPCLRTLCTLKSYTTPWLSWHPPGTWDASYFIRPDHARWPSESHLPAACRRPFVLFPLAVIVLWAIHDVKRARTTFPPPCSQCEVAKWFLLATQYLSRPHVHNLYCLVQISFALLLKIVEQSLSQLSINDSSIPDLEKLL